MRDRSSSATVLQRAAAIGLVGAAVLLAACDQPAGREMETGPPIASQPPNSAGPRCGDGYVDPGESCDDGPGNGVRGCNERCQPHPPQAPATKPIDCGDGFLDPSEVCDDGPRNGWVASACAPDCGGRVQERLIVPSRSIRSGDLGEAPVEAIDLHCPPGFAALFGDDVQRRPPQSADDRSRTWVLAPYTAYRRPDGALVWTTDGDRRLGMRRDRQVELWSSPIDCDGAPCPRALTGLSASWQPTQSRDCHAWSSSEQGTANLGDPGSKGDYLAAEPDVGCGFEDHDVIAICVEQ